MGIRTIITKFATSIFLVEFAFARMSLGAFDTFTVIIFTDFFFMKSTTVHAEFAMAVLKKMAGIFCSHFSKMFSELNEKYF